MKQLLKFTFASCLGTIFALGFVFFFFFVIASSSAPQVKITPNSLLHLKLDGNIPELTDNVPQGQFGISEGLTIGLNDIKRHIRNAASDDDISALYIQTQNTSVNPTTAYDIARAIDHFKDSGKPVYAYGDYYTQSGYIIAAMADSVFLNPNGLVDLRGYGTMIPFFEGFSRKTGIDFDVYHAGKYKSAIEPYYRANASEENRYQTKVFLQHFHDALATHVAKQRDQELEVIQKLIVSGSSNNSDDAINYGLVDGLRHPEDVADGIKANLGLKKTKLTSLQDYHAANPNIKPNHNNKIAIVYAEGDVAMGGKDRGAVSMDVYDDIFDRLEKNKKVDAVVIRVNSPGGSSFTSDRFYKRVNDLKDAGKYVVASFGDYAASGGYYIAASADKIICEPTTLTGSIGVFSMIPDMSGLSEDKLGIDWDTIGTGARTFLYSTMVSRSTGDNALLMAETERIYEVFKKIVAEGRDLTIDEVEEVAQGRVWSGVDAVDTGLIDALGSLDDAVSLAADEVGYDDYKVLEYPIIKKTFWEQMLESIADETTVKMSASTDIGSKVVRDLYGSLKTIEAACKAPLVRMPYSILIN